VVNEWLKQGQTTLFVERELGEALKRTDLPEGFSPQDLHWRWNAFRLVLPLGLFRVSSAWTTPTKKGGTRTSPSSPPQRCSSVSPSTSTRLFSRKPKRRLAVNRWATHGLTKMQCCLASNASRPTRSTKKSSIFSGGCKLDDRTLRTLAEEIDIAAEVLPFWDSDSSAFVVRIKRFIFNALLYMGSLPEEYEPEKVVRPARGKEGPIQAGVEGGPIPWQGGLPARTPADRSGA